MKHVMRLCIISSWLWAVIVGGDVGIEAQSFAKSDEADWDFADDHPREVDHVVIDFAALQFTPPLVDREETQTEFERLMWTVFEAIDRLGGLEKNAYNTDLLDEMMSFINQHRDEYAGLTMKLYLAKYLAANYQWTETGRMIGWVVMEDAMTLFETIRSECPDSWQAMSATVSLANIDYGYISRHDKDARIAQLRALRPIAIALVRIQTIWPFKRPLMAPGSR